MNLILILQLNFNQTKNALISKKSMHNFNPSCMARAFLPCSSLVAVPFGTTIANILLQKHDQVLKVGPSTNNGNNQYFEQINKY